MYPSRRHLSAKLRLFETLLPRGRTAVLNADSDAYSEFASAAIVSGSCSEATNSQVAVWRAAGRTALHIDPLALHQGTQTA